MILKIQRLEFCYIKHIVVLKSHITTTKTKWQDYYTILRIGKKGRYFNENL